MASEESAAASPVESRSRAYPGVNFYSPVGAVSGLGAAGRGYLAAMRAADIPVCVVPVHELFVHQASVKRREARQRARHAISIVHINADSVSRFLHFHARSFARARYRIAIWVWELPAFRDEWWSVIGQFDEIWVPSSFCRRAVQAVSEKPVLVMPHVAPATELPERARRAAFGIEDDAFVFLYVFDASSLVERKNPHCLIEAFERAFRGADKVRLVLKISNVGSDPDLFRELQALVARDPRCKVVLETLGERELARLIRACDCYVSPHRSEGFGLTVAEAMLMERPVIATGYGGTADFLCEEVGHPLAYRLIEIERDYGPYAKGAIWADPSRDHLEALMRAVVADPAAAARKGRLARLRMQERYSALAVGRRIGQRLAELAPSLQDRATA